MMYVMTSSEFSRWYRASLRRDLREMGMLDAPETDEEREILESYPELQELGHVHDECTPRPVEVDHLRISTDS